MSAAQDMAGRSIDPTLRLLADPGLLQKRIDQLDAAQKSAQAVIDRVGPIEDLEKTRVQAEQALAEADTALAEAVEKGNAIAKEADDRAQRTLDDATVEADKLTGEAQAKVAVAGGKLAEANSVVAAVELDKKTNEARAGELDDREASLQQKADALASREQELKGEFEKLAEVRGLIDNVLA